MIFAYQSINRNPWKIKTFIQQKETAIMACVASEAHFKYPGRNKTSRSLENSKDAMNYKKWKNPSLSKQASSSRLWI